MVLITVAAMIAVAVADWLLKLYKKGACAFSHGRCFLLFLLFYSCVLAAYGVIFNINNSVAAVCQSAWIKEINAV